MMEPTNTCPVTAEGSPAGRTGLSATASPRSPVLQSGEPPTVQTSASSGTLLRLLRGAHALGHIPEPGRSKVRVSVGIRNNTEQQQPPAWLVSSNHVLSTPHQSLIEA